MKTEIKKRIWHYTKLYGILTMLAFVRALATYVFIIPNGFAPGGVSGIASILYNIIVPINAELANGWFNPAVTVFVMNAPLLILAFKLLDKNFAINTLICVAFFSIFMGVFSAVGFPQFIAKDYNNMSIVPFLAALAGGVLLGFCLGIMLRLNSCAGGTDIMGKIFYKKNPIMDVQWLIFMIDCIVVLASGTVALFDLDYSSATPSDILVAILIPIFYSFISLFACSKVADIVHAGFESSLVFFIITEKPAEISEAVIRKVRRGATLIQSEGMYSHKEKDMVICVVKKKQISLMKGLIKGIDENAFLFISTAREVAGRGFTKTLEGKDIEEI